MDEKGTLIKNKNTSKVSVLLRLNPYINKIVAMHGIRNIRGVRVSC